MILLMENDRCNALFRDGNLINLQIDKINIMKYERRRKSCLENFRNELPAVTDGDGKPFPTVHYRRRAMLVRAIKTEFRQNGKEENSETCYAVENVIAPGAFGYENEPLE